MKVVKTKYGIQITKHWNNEMYDHNDMVAELMKAELLIKLELAKETDDEELLRNVAKIIHPSGYGKVGTDDGFDAILWRKFKIRWKISGSDYDIIDRVGNIKEAGIIDTNMRTVAVTSETYPSLMEYITDYREFSKF